MDQDTLQRTLDAIDAVTTCGWCGATLTADAPSFDYCTELHQDLWLARHGRPRVKLVPVVGDLLINGHAVPTVPGSARVMVFFDEIASLGASFVEAVAYPRLAELRAEHAQQQDLEQHRRRMLEGDWESHEPMPIGEVFARLAGYIPGFLDGIHAATSHDGKPPADPRARALWLHQHRNTGPAPRRRRPPKNLTP